MMTICRRLLLPVLLIALPGHAQLNPTVKVLARPTALVPADCDQSLAPQPALHVSPEEKAAVRDTRADMQPPPSVTLRSELRAALEAGQQGYRGRFHDSLMRAKSLLTAYPPGAERTAAANSIAVLDDIDRIWDFQFSSPTGSFFEAGSNIHKIAAAYPGYEASVRRQIIVDERGTHYYPTHETRDFLAGEAASRLAPLIGQAAPKRPTPPREVTMPAPRKAPAPHTTTAPSREPARKPATTTHAPVRRPARTHKPVTQEAHVSPAPSPRTPRRTEPVQSKPAPPQPAPQKPAPAKPEIEPSPALRTQAPIVATTRTSSTATSGSTTGETASTKTTTTASDTSVTETTASETATDTTATSRAAKPQGSSRGFAIPFLLILVGLGVLVLLFRASS